MASINFACVMGFALVLATSSAAPTQDGDVGIKIPDECQGEGFCTVKPEGYDELAEKINSVLPPILVKNYADRYGPEDKVQAPRLSPKSDWHNCPYETKVESMYIYNHGNNSTKTEIIVQTNLFRQYVEVVTCAQKYIDAGSDEQCFQDLSVKAFHMKSSCETTTARRTLYVFDIEKSKIIQKSFEVPACCTCKVSYD